MKLSFSGLGEYKRRRGDYQFMFNCPFHEDTNFHLGVNTKKGIYHCFKCNMSGRLSDIEIPLSSFQDRVKEILGEKPGQGRAITSFQASPRIALTCKVSLPGESKIVSLQSGLPYRYLKLRRVTDKEIIKYKIHYCSEGLFHDRIIIPIYNIDKVLIYFVGRAYLNLNPKYLNAPVPKEEIVYRTELETTDEVVVCEGIFDALRIGKVKPAVALLGKVASRKQINLITSHVRRLIYVMLDSDAKQEAFILYNQLSYYKKTRLILLDKKDPGSLQTEELERRFK